MTLKWHLRVSCFDCPVVSSYLCIFQVEERVIVNAKVKCVELSKKGSLHLNNPETKNKLLQLIYGEMMSEPLPTAAFCKIEHSVKRIMNNQIQNELNLFLQNKQMEKLDSDFDSMFVKEVQLVFEQSKEVWRLLLNYKGPSIVHKFSTTFTLLRRNAFFSVLPLCILPFTYLLIATNTVGRMLNQPKESDKIDEFNLKPFKFLSEWYDEMLLRRFSEKEMYCRLKSEYIKPFKQKIKHVFRSIIQQQIKADNVFIMNLTNDIRSYKEIRKVYLPFGEKAKVMMGKLLLVGMEYFSKDTIATVNSRNYSQEQKWKGRFAQVGTIEMLHGQKWVKAVVKTMKRPLNNDISLIQLTEVDSLR